MIPKQDRRQDAQLRAAIDRVRTNAKEIKDCSGIYQRALNEICGITQSPIGLIVEKTPAAQGLEFNALALQYKPTFDPSPPPASRRVSKSSPKLKAVLNSQFKFLSRVLTYRAVEVFHPEHLKQIPTTSLGWPQLKQMLAIPLVDRHQIIAVVLLANSPIPYSEDTAARCWPLLTSTICLHRVLKTSRNLPVVLNHCEERRDHSWEDLFFLLERHIDSGVITIDNRYSVVRLNPEAEKIFRVDAETAVGSAITDFIPEGFPGQDHNYQRRRLCGKRGDGSTVPLAITAIPYRSQRQQYFLLTVRDTTETDTMRADGETLTQRLKAVTNLIPIGILQTDREWQAQYANDHWCDICGLSRQEVLGLGWINGLFQDDVEQTLKNLRQALSEGREFSGEARFHPPGGEVVWVELHAQPVFTDLGEISGFIATTIDCTYRHQAEHKLRVMAEQDALTGLANRAVFQDRLQHALTRADRRGAVALLCLDLDGFKSVNDTLGHDAGDQLLQAVAQRLLSCVRVEDTVARIGGDEFMILMEDLPNATIAADVSEKILKQLEAPCSVGQQEVFVSTSIGISFAVGHQGTDIKTLMKQADIALYRAKSQGRNNFQYFSPELESASKDRLYLGNCLHRALDRAEFEVFYQLQADSGNRTIVGSEALLRWMHPERGQLAPSDFIPLLEETSLITPVSRWLWFEAFQQHKSWLDRDLMPEGSHIAINLSARQLRDKQLAHSFESALKDSQLPGKAVVAEITESALIENTGRTAEILNTLKELGVQIALDDFGTGYSSLTHLKKFAIDIIKIDRSFILDLLHDPEDAAITKGVVSLARSLNLTVVSEGVENRETLALLQEWGCDTYQGYYLHKPSKPEQVEAALRLFPPK